MTPVLPTELPASFAQMFADRVAATPSKEAFRYPSGSGWTSLTWAQTKERVYDLAAGLVALGVESGRRVAVASSTRIDWVLADLAILCAGAATTTVYPATAQPDVGYILSDSGSVVVFAENADQVAKVKASDLPDLMAIVAFDAVSDDDVLSMDELAAKGAALRAEHPGVVDERIAGLDKDSLATLIYTSGTTGKPKGVRLAHEAWVYEGAAIDAYQIIFADDVQYLWLPLSHVFGKVLLAAQLRIGFATAVDGNLDKIVENLAVVQPTFMAGAPRIFEKVRAKVTLTAQGEGGLKAKIFDWAIGVGVAASRDRQAHRSHGPLHKVKLGIADKLVFSTIRGRLGGKVRFFVSGSAALSKDVAEWFDAVGMMVIEGYGLTESSAATFVNPPFDMRIGSVGPALPGTEVKLAGDGEILVKGPGVMRGYHNKPEATAETIEDGWLHTGDIGELVDGYLRITDRKKDLIKTSGGKYVAPQKLEVTFKAVCPYASQIIVHGDGRKFVSALITLDEESIMGWAEKNSLGDLTYPEVVSSPEVRVLIEGYVKQLNDRLERWETVKKFHILDHDLSVDSGHMTPSMKVKRNAVENHYRALLDEFYVD